MSSIYQSAVNAYCAEIHRIGVEFIPFAIWLERKKQRGQYWEMPFGISSSN